MKVIYDKINTINKEIESIKAKMNRETQFNRNVEMNIKIMRLKKERDKLKVILD